MQIYQPFISALAASGPALNVQRLGYCNAVQTNNNLKSHLNLTVKHNLPFRELGDVLSEAAEL